MDERSGTDLTEARTEADGAAQTSLVSQSNGRRRVVGKLFCFGDGSQEKLQNRLLK